MISLNYYRFFPSFLTISRIVVAPLCVKLLANKHYGMASVLLMYAGITDFLDGFLARKWNVTSRIGALLDVLADKCIMLSASIGLLVYIPTISMRWFLYAIVVREIYMILGFCIYLLTAGQLYSDSLYLGKVSMALQFVLITLMIMNLGIKTDLISWAKPLFMIGFCTIVISLIFYAIRFYYGATSAVQRNI